MVHSPVRDKFDGQVMIGVLTKAMSLRPSSSLQFLFFSLWASSMITQLHWIFRSSGQSAKIISKVVIIALNLKMPWMGRPCKIKKTMKIH